LPFPLPWHLIPLNIYYVFWIVFFGVFNFRGAAIRRHVKAETGADVVTVLEVNVRPPAGFKELVAIRPELDFPMWVPPHIVPCGPILRPAPAVAEADPELAAWLARGPTVVINQGTHAETGERGALQMAGALRIMFDAAAVKGGKAGARLQVMWKINKYGEYDVDRPGCKVYGLLGPEIEEGRVKMVGWLSAEPHSILLSGNVVCSINHGGANSFFEALG
jgi:hypothetical protein